jgi:hypothetical protein
VVIVIDLGVIVDVSRLAVRVIKAPGSVSLLHRLMEFFRSIVLIEEKSRCRVYRLLHSLSLRAERWRL